MSKYALSTSLCLVSQTPGGLHERFFEEIGQEAQDKFKPTAHKGGLNAERIAAIAAMYGVEIPPPISNW